MRAFVWGSLENKSELKLGLKFRPWHSVSESIFLSQKTFPGIIIIRDFPSRSQEAASRMKKPSEKTIKQKSDEKTQRPAKTTPGGIPRRENPATSSKPGDFTPDDIR